VAAYLYAIAQRNTRDPLTFTEQVLNYLSTTGCVIGSVVRLQGLCLTTPQDSSADVPSAAASTYMNLAGLYRVPKRARRPCTVDYCSGNTRLLQLPGDTRWRYLPAQTVRN